jgi:DNA-binding GntR family transcriptional regulator
MALKTENLAIDRPEPLKYIVYEKVRSAIMFGQFKQGEVLNERALADALSVSRTPVRLALELLLNDGWVYREGKSVRINYTYYEDFCELLPIRLENEKLAMKLALPKLNDFHLNEIAKILKRMARCAQHIQERNWESDKRNFLEQERRFHLYFAEVSGNKHLYRLMSEYLDRFLRLGMVSLRYQDDSVMTHKKMEEIFESVKRNDLDRAFQILEQELNRGGDLAEKFLRKML